MACLLREKKNPQLYLIFMNSHSKNTNPSGNACVLITRPLHQSARLAEELRSHGVQVEELPLIRICPPDSWEDFDRAFASLVEYEWLVFASSNAVETTFARVRQLECHLPPTNLIEQLQRLKIACIGPTTAATLLNYGVNAKLTPQAAIAESLAKDFPSADLAEGSSRKILWIRTNIGRLTLKDSLEKLGWQVDIVHSYKTEGPEKPQESASKLRTLLQSGRISAITLTSSETVRKLQAILSIAAEEDPSLLESFPGNIKLAVIGPETAGTCRSIFGRVDIEASEHTSHGLASALLEQTR